MKIVIITGPSGSGKSTLSNLLDENLSNAIILNTDNYYKIGFISRVLSTFIKAYFDKPISFNRKLLQKDIKKILEKRKLSHIYKYDFINKKRIKLFKEKNKVEYLIIEGIFALEIIKFLEKYEFILIKMTTRKVLCRERACQRDCKERGKDFNQSLKEFNYAWKTYARKEKRFKLNKFKNLYFIKKASDYNKILKILSTNAS